MKIVFNYISYQSYGGLIPEAQYLDDYLTDILVEKGFKSSIEEIEVTFAFSSHPQIRKKASNTEIRWWSWYNDLPQIRFTNGRKKVNITVQTPEVLFYKKQSQVEVNKYLIGQFIGVASLVQTKVKKDDVFDYKLFCEIIQPANILITENTISDRKIVYDKKYRDKRYTINVSERKSRQNSNSEKNKLIQDIRLYHGISEWGNLNKKDLNIVALCKKIVNELRLRKFRCPQYTHLYIMAAESQDSALYNITATEEWFVYGIAVANDIHKFNSLSKIVKKKYIFNLIKIGLLDIAEIDRLDTNILTEVLNKVESTLVE